MVYKVLGMLLCISVMSLVSGCYCYPPGYYPRGHRYSSISSYRPYSHHAKEEDLSDGSVGCQWIDVS
jgi:hypothetical protein